MRSTSSARSWPSATARSSCSCSACRCHDGDPAQGKKGGRARNAPKCNLRAQLFRMCGVDLTRIDGVDVTTALAVVSEIGTDMSRFPTVKHFTSWLGLCPGTKITGGKVMSGKTKRVVDRASQALRLAAAARLLYAMLTQGEEYTDQGQEYYEQRYREGVLRALSQRAANLGMKMGPHRAGSQKTCCGLSRLEGVS